MPVTEMVLAEGPAHPITLEEAQEAKVAEEWTATPVMQYLHVIETTVEAAMITALTDLPHPGADEDVVIGVGTDMMPGGGAGRGLRLDEVEGDIAPAQLLEMMLTTCHFLTGNHIKFQMCKSLQSITSIGMFVHHLHVTSLTSLVIILPGLKIASGNRASASMYSSSVLDFQSMRSYEDRSWRVYWRLSNSMVKQLPRTELVFRYSTGEQVPVMFNLRVRLLYPPLYFYYNPY